MTVYFAQQSTNINAANVWNTAANGSGSYLTWPPASGDVLMANGQAITVNVNTTVAEVRNGTENGATINGIFTLLNGVTLTANAINTDATNTLIFFEQPSPNIANIVGNTTTGNSWYTIDNYGTGTLNITGNITASNRKSNCHGARNNSLGILNITGNVTGGSSYPSSHGVVFGSGTVNILGNVTGGTFNSCHGINKTGGVLNVTGNIYAGAMGNGIIINRSNTGAVTINGNVYGGNDATSWNYIGLQNDSVATVTINGTVYAGSKGGTGAYNSYTGTLIVDKAVGCGYGKGSSNEVYSYGIYDVGLGETRVKQIQFGARGANPIIGNVFIEPATSNQAIFTKTDLSTITLARTDGTDFGNPIQANVRNGTVYALGNLTGTCHVPTANQVAYGVPVDNTTGTALLTAAAIRAELATELSRIDATISSRSTLTAGDIPAGLSAGDIADAVRTEIAPELAIIEAINDRIELQVPDGPVLVVPAPSAGQTTAWTMCYDEHGEPEADVPITVRLYGTGTAATSAWDAAAITVNSSAEGLASLSLPRNAGLRFQVRRGLGPWVKFSGVDAETLELPAILA